MMARGLLLALALGAGNLLAEAPSGERAKAQEAYRNWRLVDPNLEADAANNPASIGARADRVAAEAAKYFAARQAYLSELGREAEQVYRRLDGKPSATETRESAAMAGQITNASNAVSNNLSAISDSSDSGLRDLRKALERERAALNAISSAMKDSRQARDALGESLRPAATARTNAMERFRELSAGIGEESGSAQKIASAWASYYRSLASGARDSAAVSANNQAKPVLVPSAAPLPAERAKEAPPVSETAAAPPAALSIAAISITAPKDNAPKEDAVPAPATAGAVRLSTPGTPPASRYLGEWVYPTVGEHYHGARPESVKLTVAEDKGQISGTFHAKFRQPPGSKLDPVVDFTFAGAYQSARMQSFPLTLGDGTTGMVELIPASTFNLLEINFTISERGGKINRGNFFIIRK